VKGKLSSVTLNDLEIPVVVHALRLALEYRETDKRSCTVLADCPEKGRIIDFVTNVDMTEVVARDISAFKRMLRKFGRRQLRRRK